MKFLDSRRLMAAGPILGLVAIVTLFTILCRMQADPINFLNPINLKTMLTHTVIVGIAALGMTIVIASGGIDLSVGSVVALGTTVLALCLNNLLLAGYSPLLAPVLAALACVAVCGASGAVNGVLIACPLRIVPFIVTLGTMQLARGAANWLGRESKVDTTRNWLQNWMDVHPDPAWLVFAPGVWLGLFLLAGTAILLKWTVFGRYVYALGSNEETARLCGVNIAWNKVWIYVLGGLFAGVAAVLEYSRLTVGDPTTRGGMELEVIAAVVIGGASLSGGVGSVWGTIIGALIMTALSNGCTMLGLASYTQKIIVGGIIIAAVAMDRLRHRR